MLKPFATTRTIAVISLLFCQAQLYAQGSALFPRPPELEPAVQFWVRVYTDVDTKSGFLHDSQNLSVVYRTLPLDSTQIEANRRQIQEDLQVLASGKRTQLTSSQQQTLSRWPTGVSNATLAQAASNVRWQLGQSDRFREGLVRSGAYRAHINQVIRERNLPLELSVLPHVESSFNPIAYSSAAAAGMWQFTPDTGKRFMQIDHIVDERMDPYTATGAAMSLLEYNYSILGTWPLALTAYNHGAGGMARAKRELGTDRIERIVADYKGRAFGFASRNFYAQFLAVLDVENNLRKYFGDVRLDPAPQFVEVTTDAYIDAEVFASSVGVSLEQMRKDNPALRPIVWSGNKRIPKGFTVKLRSEAVGEFAILLARIPNDFKFNVQTPDVAYVVVSGDSLSVIARRFNTSVARLVALNQLPSQHRISIGQRLLLPQDSVPVDERVPVTLLAASTVPIQKPANGIYNVNRGDTLSLIADRFGVGAAELMRINALQDPHRIYAGQQLTLPGFENPQQGVINAAMTPSPPTEVRFTDQDSENPVAEEIDTLVGPPVLLAMQQQNRSEVVNPLEEEVVQSGAADEQELAQAVSVVLSIEESNQQLQDALAADPSDYRVAENKTIEIHASETLGHYADWLGLRAADLRRLNAMAASNPVVIGERLKLDFGKVSTEEFEVKRREFHLRQQQEFFTQYRIQHVEHYKIAPNDNISSIARQRYSTPMWLLRQYNPGLDFNRVQIGQEIVFPVLEAAN